MPIGSGGGGGPAGGTYLPTGTKAGVALDTTTYTDTVRGGGAKLNTLVFTTEGAALALAMLGDAFPRLFLTSRPDDAIFYASDGTVDPENGNGMLGLSANGSSFLSGWGSANGGIVTAGVIGANRGITNGSSRGLTLNSAAMVTSGTGAPAAGGEVGDLYVRVDGAALSTIYRCTVAGAAGLATWAGIL